MKQQGWDSKMFQFFLFFCQQCKSMIEYNS